MDVLRDYLLRVKLDINTSDDVSTDESPDNIDGDEQEGSSPSIRQQLLDLWNRLNRR